MVVKKLLSTLRHCKTQSALKQLHAMAITMGLLHHQPMTCKFLNSYSNLGLLKEAHTLFFSIPDPDLISWTSLITLRLHSNLLASAISAFSELLLSHISPDSFSSSAAISACARSNNLSAGTAIHAISFRFHLVSLPPVCNSLIYMYGRTKNLQSAITVFQTMVCRDQISWSSMLYSFILCGDLNSACHLFDEMPELNSVSWTTMMTGFVRERSPTMALKAFKEMHAERRDRPTVVTVVAVLSGCRDVGVVHSGGCIHGYVHKFGMDNNVVVSNALVDMYAKCGCLRDAGKVFEEIDKKDVISWTSMIFALALHGDASRVIGVFSDMVGSGVHPNEATFMGLMLACSHGGMVVEGMKTFESMSRCAELSVIHYGCVVDVLCRKGFLKEAKGFIERMPVDPDAAMWRSFLSGCLAHGEMGLAETVRKRVVEEHGEDGEINVLLCNIYRFGEKREDASSVRSKMEELKLKKMVGSSWVQTSVF